MRRIVTVPSPASDIVPSEVDGDLSIASPRETSTSPERSRRVGRPWMWAAAAACVSLLPYLQALTGTRIFYARDLSLFFWGRFLWLRRAWFSGEWPLWDSFVAAGQAAYSDPLHQMFFPPAVVVRLIGNEVMGFNLWVVAPFPVMAIGTWIFLARRFSAQASALGAVAFAVCGPVVSGSNFPNLSWCVAMLPWVLWATDRLISSRTRRDVAVLAVVVAFQCLAGEPVTTFATLALALGYTCGVGAPTGEQTFGQVTRAVILVGLGAALGMALAAIQLIPMVWASRLAERGDLIMPDAWSLRPTALLETIWLHLFGDYYTVQSLDEVPWLPLTNTGREPLLVSLYFGVPLLALAILGMAGTAPRRWRLFWTASGLVSLVAAFGSYTPLYPILRDHVPPFGTFRFPVKFIVVGCMAVAAGAAAGWDALQSRRNYSAGDPNDRRSRRALLVAIGFALTAGCLTGAFAAATIYFPAQIAGPLQAFADRLGDESDTAAEFMLRTVPAGAGSVVIAALSAGVLILVIARTRYASTAARYALYGLIAADLLIRAWGVNPSFDPAHVAEPAWLSYTRADPDARFYVGGKINGTLTSMDIDASRGYVNPPGLRGSASRAALSNQAAFYPSPWQAREMLSHDLPVLWPRAFRDASELFVKSGAADRERFLDRTGVRYRVLPQRRAAGRTPLAGIPQFHESFLFDWGSGVSPRVSMVPRVRIQADVNQQIEALFAADWDSRTVAMIDRDPPFSGIAGSPVFPFARFVEQRANRVVIEAGAASGGGYLLLLDSYSDDWRVTVDALDSTMVRANGLFRAVHLSEGVHHVEFVYRPRALIWGATVSLLAAVVVIGLLGAHGILTRAARPSFDFS